MGLEAPVDKAPAGRRAACQGDHNGWSMNDEAESSSERRKASSSRRVWTETVILALVPVVGYSLAYRYEQGICEYYGLPGEIIDLSLWSVIGVSLGLFAGLFSVLLVLNAAAMILLSTGMARHALRLHPKIRFKWGLLAVLAIPYLYVGGWKMWMFLAIFAGFLGAIDFVIPILARGHKGRLAAVNEAEQQDIDAWTRPMQLLPRKLFWLPLVLLVTWNALNCASLAGERSASTGGAFQCVEVESAQYAVLRIYGGIAYCGEVDGASKRLTGRYQALPVGGQTWTSRVIGPLKPPEPAKAD